MTTNQIATLIFKDQAGEYYVLPQALLERGRVPEERREELEQALSGADDVTGHHPAIVGAAIGMIVVGGSMAAYGWLTSPGESLGDVLQSGIDWAERQR